MEYKIIPCKQWDKVEYYRIAYKKGNIWEFYPAKVVDGEYYYDIFPDKRSALDAVKKLIQQKEENK